MSRFDNPVRSYIIAFVVALILTLIPQLLSDQKSLFLAINQINSPFLDQFFYWLTYLGDGLAFALVIVILVFYSYRQALLGLIIFLVTAGIAQFLKRVFFNDRIRPYGKLGSDFDLYIPDGVDPLFYNSFPSGHTTTVFALATFLVLIFHKRIHWLILLLLAILVGYSRIYLTHHFPIDVWVGSLIGTVGTLALYWWLDSKLDNKFGDKGLIRK